MGCGGRGSFTSSWRLIKLNEVVIAQKSDQSSLLLQRSLRGERLPAPPTYNTIPWDCSPSSPHLPHPIPTVQPSPAPASLLSPPVASVPLQTSPPFKRPCVGSPCRPYLILLPDGHPSESSSCYFPLACLTNTTL